MNVQCNVYNLEAKFSNYLSNNNYSRTSKNNYVSDIRKFFSWYSLELKRQHLRFNVNTISKNTIDSYIVYLRTNNTPVQTINRQLSAIRTFIKFCLHEGYISRNPLHEVKNVRARFKDKALFWLRRYRATFIAFFIGFLPIAGLLVIPMLAGKQDKYDVSDPISLPERYSSLLYSSVAAVASTSADLLTIPIVDSRGNINLTAPYPGIIGYIGTLRIKAPSITIASQDKGTITLKTKEGSLHVLFEGEKPQLPYESAIYVSANELVSGTLIGANAGNSSPNINLLDLTSGSPPETRFRIDGQGNVYIKGNLILEGNLIVNPQSTIFGSIETRSATSSYSPLIISE